MKIPLNPPLIKGGRVGFLLVGVNTAIFMTIKAEKGGGDL
jgi:hypothetical protein